MFRIIINETRSFLRNGMVMFICILFPSLCTFILGTMLEDLENSDDTVGDLTVAYCIENGGFSKDSFEQFILALEDENVISAERITIDELDDISEKYSAAVELDGTDIIIYNGENAIQNRAVKALMDGYNKNAAAYISVAEKAPQALLDIGSIVNEDKYIVQKDFGRTRTMMDYYAVAMTVLIIFFGSMMGGAEAYRNEGEIRRLYISPVNRTGVYFAKIIGALPQLLMQTAAVMLFSTLFFGAHYCNTFSGNLLLFAMFFSSSLAVLAFGILTGLLFPKIQPWSVLMPLNWVMLFFSGVFQKDIEIKGISDYLPPDIILNAAFDLTVFSRSGKAVGVILWSLGIFAVFIVIGGIKVNSRGKNA